MDLMVKKKDDTVIRQIGLLSTISIYFVNLTTIGRKLYLQMSRKVQHNYDKHLDER